MNQRRRQTGIQTVCLAVVLGSLAGVGRATDWSTSLPCFQGGSYDGSAQCSATNIAGLGGGVVSLSSGADQSFAWTDTNAVLDSLTIEATDPAGSITNGGTMRIAVPAAWQCRFDTGATVSCGGDASSKVGTTSFSSDGRTLLIPVTTGFGVDDTLTISGLELIDLALCRYGAQRLELDFDGDGLLDVYDEYTIQALVPQNGGSFDGWDRCELTNTVGLGSVDVSLSSGIDQSFDWTNTNAALAVLTIEVTSPASSMTNGGVLGIVVPAAWQCRFDTGVTVSFGGDAVGKVGTASVSSDGRTLLIPMTADFSANDTLTIDGLELVQLALCREGSQWLGLDFNDDGVPDVYDGYAIRALVPHSGGAYDGWDQGASTNTVKLGSAEVSLSSGSDQSLAWTDADATLAIVTIEVTSPASSMTNGGTLGIAVPPAWQCRFDTGVTVTCGGDAAGKVGTTSFSADGRTLLIPLTADFSADDTLTIDGLELIQLALCREGPQRLGLDFNDDGAPDVYDDYTVRALVPQSGGPYDGWSSEAMTEDASICPPGGTIFIVR